MPSWNIHTAHVERLFESDAFASWGIASKDAFLFGNLAPDIYVGYVVSPITKKMEYRDTHLAKPDFIPKPNAALFYQRYLCDGHPSDVALGAWTHLICDHYYNLRTNEYIQSVGVRPGEQTRIRKQADFDLFGRTLDIAGVPRVSPELLRQCASFPQYPIEEADVRQTVLVQAQIVERNRTDHVAGTPSYDLLPASFFRETFAEVDALLREALTLHAQGGDPTRIGASEDAL